MVFTSTLSLDATLVTVSVTTVQLEPAGTGFLLVLTLWHLDGHELATSREQGTGALLDALAEFYAGCQGTGMTLLH